MLAPDKGDIGNKINPMSLEISDNIVKNIANRRP